MPGLTVVALVLSVAVVALTVTMLIMGRERRSAVSLLFLGAAMATVTIGQILQETPSLPLLIAIIVLAVIGVVSGIIGLARKPVASSETE
ncbi:hypothetical protein [Microbacterium gilvum]|uniref:Uncharacterized protein n=1 Tax=Microbacterium gilvum TaxID=1336204 RepID=A0ABP9AB95_9MICO